MTDDAKELTLRLTLWAILMEYMGEIWPVHLEGKMFSGVRFGQSNFVIPDGSYFKP